MNVFAMAARVSTLIRAAGFCQLRQLIKQGLAHNEVYVEILLFLRDAVRRERQEKWARNITRIAAFVGYAHRT
jgi:hypothetical protein